MPTAVAPPVTDFAEFVAAQSLNLTRFAYLLCGDHAFAEDLVQDVLVQLYRRFGDELAVAAPVAYARRAVVNTHISRRRLRSSTEQVTDLLPERPAYDTDGAERDAMWRALRTLPDRQRAVLVLRYYSDLSDDEIADALECRPGTVRSLAARAFATLRTHPGLQEGSR